MEEINGKNLLGFEESATSATTFTAKDPSTNLDLEIQFHEADRNEIDRAIHKAASAFPAFQEISAMKKAGLLDAIAAEIEDLGDPLIQRCMQETALPKARLIGERGRTVNQLRLFASVVKEGSWVDARIDTAIPDRQPVPKPDVRQMLIPLGPVGIFGASNFPLAFSVAGGDTASALAAGCPVIVKAHPLHPSTSEMVGRAIIAAIKKLGLPEGIFSLIQGKTNETGMEIVTHPSITAIGFTGSFKGGKAIFDAANKREVPIPVYAEMGSVNPVFILPGAMKERSNELAAGLVNSFILGVGQFCTNPGVVVTLESNETREFNETLIEKTRNASPGTMLSSEIKNRYSGGVSTLVERKDVELLASSSGQENENNVQANVFGTTASAFTKDKQLADEVFGPSTLEVTANSKEELLKVAENLEGHLTATIHGTEEDLEEYSDLVKILIRKVGRLIFNGFPTGVEVCHSMTHGGPFPATTDSRSTSVGTLAIKRFARPVSFQDFPEKTLPDELKDSNPLGIWRMVNGEFRRD
ncbi:aldehyde dehydrogenase (NADP(+)) [Bacteroidota bacterium]